MASFRAVTGHEFRHAAAVQRCCIPVKKGCEMTRENVGERRMLRGRIALAVKRNLITDTDFP
ncbi:hypothetical protein PANT111_190282 [Pantoea brenneri]|uniref:Uncharacterized protein n=1 Tax=Pantoea brenneri TaxID=472694 RepID=A0AAX3J6R9_9GAMM|nr:hypothetical protein PANT111_190282 [Pantoea brenneri]